MKLLPDQGLASLRLLTYRLDLGDMGDVRMAIFHFFHRQKMYFGKGFTVNGFTVNGFTASGFTINGFTVNGFTASGFPSILKIFGIEGHRK